MRKALGGIIGPAVLFMMMLGGCGAGISKEVMAQVDTAVTFRDVLRNPDQYRGRMVVFSGSIWKTTNKESGTELIVIHHPSKPGRRPVDPDVSEGRFAADDRRFLDAAIYAPGRAVTVAGRVAGVRKMPLGDTEYAYPVIAVEELHLWRAPPGFNWGFIFSTHF